MRALVGHGVFAPVETRLPRRNDPVEREPKPRLKGKDPSGIGTRDPVDPNNVSKRRTDRPLTTVEVVQGTSNETWWAWTWSSSEAWWHEHTCGFLGKKRIVCLERKGAWKRRKRWSKDALLYH